MHAAVEQLLAAGAIDLHTTYFETVTAMALLVFAEEAVDMVVLEVGLGGRLDATNVVTPELCVITPIDFDHEAFLGRSLEAIAGEKAGILKAGVPAVFARQRSEAAAVLDLRAAQLCIPVARTEAWTIDDLELDARGSRFLLQRRTRAAHRVPAGRRASGGECRHRRGGADAARDFRSRNRYAGSRRPAGPDGWSAFPNIPRSSWMARTIPPARARWPHTSRAFTRGRRVRLIYGAMRDKAIDEISGILFPLAQQVIVTAPRQARALSPESIRQVAEHPICAPRPILHDALAMVKDATAEDVIFITGSLFLVAEAREMLVL